MKHTGMRRSAFYQYFDDRYGLVLGLVRRIEAEMMDASLLWLEDSGDQPTSLATALDAAIRVWGRHGHVLRAIHEAGYHDAQVQRYFRGELVDPFIAAVAERLEAENRAGRTAIPSPRDTAHALVALNVAVLSERLGRSPAERPSTVSKTLQYMWRQVIYGATSVGTGGDSRVGAAESAPT